MGEGLQPGKRVCLEFCRPQRLPVARPGREVGMGGEEGGAGRSATPYGAGRGLFRGRLGEARAGAGGIGRGVGERGHSHVGSE